MMGFYLSDINNNLIYKEETEVEFFTRLTTKGYDKRCVFVSDPKYIRLVDDTVSMVITDENLAERLTSRGYSGGFCISKEPKTTYYDLLIEYENVKTDCEKTIIGKNCAISPNAIVPEWGVIIGNNVIIEDFVKIYPNTFIGNSVTIQSGAVVGAELFYTYKKEGIQKQIPQNGKVIIGDDVLIGSNCVVARGMYDYGCTEIKSGAKIDALVSISHNDIIGENSIICSGASLGGYVQVGADSGIALGANVKNGVSIGKRVMVGMGSVILFDIKDDEIWFGNPAKRLT